MSTDRCGAPTSSGTPCRNPAETCPHHPGPSPSGRPSLYTEGMADEIYERIVEGESLRSICRDEDMPGTTTVVRWLSDKPDFRARYVDACAARADADATEIVEIADDAKPEDVQVAKLRVDARKWVASRLLPNYSDKMELSGRDGGPLEVSVTRRVVKAEKADGEDP